MAASASRSQLLLLFGLVAVLVVVVGYQLRGWRQSPAGGAAPRGTAGGASQSAESPLPVPEVRLEALQAPRPDPVSDRNLFRERPKAPPPPPAAIRPAPAADPNAPPPGPPPPPPITLKFIGVVQAGGRSIAVLSDGRDVMYGREGELVDGRYRIIKINVESVEISYADGRGRRVIPLTG